MGLLLCLTGDAATESNGFYAYHDSAAGIDLQVHSSVHPDAVAAAKRTIEKMLSARPDIAGRMQARQARLSIIPRDRFITFLPEFARLSGTNDPNGTAYDSFGVRGAGGIPSQPVTATSEENLRKLPGDPFAGEDVTTHEFAHAIMNLGFSDEERRGWTQLYQAAKRRKAFPGAFAMTHEDEYWAELSQSYFGVNNEINGRETVGRGDPEALKFLAAVYGS